MKTYKRDWETPTAIGTRFTKPLYGSLCYLREEKIKKAKRFNKTLVVEAPIDEDGKIGKATYTADEWMKGAKFMSKEFLIPGVPMRLWGKHIKMDVEKREKRKKEEAKYETKNYARVREQAGRLAEMARSQGII